MLTIGKLGHGQESYYLEAVADGAEEYYVLAGEAPGRWSGCGDAELGLRGSVSAADFTAVLRGEDPRTGAPLSRHRGKVPGFDLTFSAPKSVSLLFALGDPELSRRMSDAHDAAVADALSYLEEVAAHGRRGHGGAVRIRTAGFVAAAFRHRTSRAGDPHLHSHVVVVNRVLGVDGQWTALDARALYAQARTAGHLYQASLRHQLADLELTWSVARTGLGEIDQVPGQVRRAFSRRRAEIEGALARRGLTSAAAAQAANLSTRTTKGDAVRQVESLRDDWRARAAALGFSPPQVPTRAIRSAAASLDVDRLLGPDGLTKQASTFGEREVLRAVANALPAGAPASRVRDLARAALASSSIVPVDQRDAILRGQDVQRSRQGRVVPLGASEQRYTTRELLALEAALVSGAVAVRGRQGPAADEGHLRAAVAAVPHLNDEQRCLVNALTTGRDGVQVVNAPAGSGKTTALAAVVAAYQRSGVPVVGTTLSAKAAGVLRDQAGLETFTTTRFLADLSDPRAGGLPHQCVVIVDEASQVGTRALARIFGAVRSVDGKLILVGDPHQLSEIDAGGAYRGLLARLTPLELQHNHRQRDPADRERLAELRRGDVVRALSDYDRAGLVVRAASSESLCDGLVADWAAHYLEAGDEASRADVVMLGLTNQDVDDLNQRARTLLGEKGFLAGPEVMLGGRSFSVGDHVVTRRNDRRRGVLNGERWRVTAAGPKGLELHPVGRDGEPVRLPSGYVEQPGWVQHAYALTVAVSQGSTVDRSYVLGSDATYREAGYTAASRARVETRFYVVGREPLDTDERWAPAEEVDPLDAFTQALQRKAAQALALDTVDGIEPVYG